MHIKLNNFFFPTKHSPTVYFTNYLFFFFCKACTTFPHDLRFFPNPENIVSWARASVHLLHISGWRISTGCSMIPIFMSLDTVRVKSFGLHSIPQCLWIWDTTFASTSILLTAPGASSPPSWSSRYGHRSPIQTIPISRIIPPGFRHHLLPLPRRDDLVREWHGDQPQVTRAKSSQTPVWWMANGIY